MAKLKVEDATQAKNVLDIPQTQAVSKEDKNPKKKQTNQHKKGAKKAGSKNDVSEPTRKKKSC